jgi:hypothetical protein
MAVRVFSVRVILLASAIVAVSLPYKASASLTASTQGPGEFGASREQIIETPSFQDASFASDSNFTESFLNNSVPAGVGDAVIVPDKSKYSGDDKLPGTKVPESGTFCLALAGLVGIARFSGRTKHSSNQLSGTRRTVR